MKDLLDLPFEKRNAEWEAQFFKKLLEEPVSVLNADPQEGPDGFPYLMVASGENVDPKDEDKFANIAKWCASRGIGVVINPDKENADYVFTFGMLWNFLLRGQFLTPTPVTKVSGAMSINGGQTVLMGPPSEDYWPTPIRNIFREFLLQQGIFEIKTLLLFEEKDGPADLCFSLESLTNPPQSEWEGILEAFSWFFPSHYSLSLISEKNFKTEFFKL